MSRVSLARSLEDVEAAARKVIAAVVEDGMMHKYLLMLKHLFNHKPFNTIDLCRQIAHQVIENGIENGQCTNN